MHVVTSIKQPIFWKYLDTFKHFYSKILIRSKRSKFVLNRKNNKIYVVDCSWTKNRLFLQITKTNRVTWMLQAEARAEFAERSVQKLQKEVDRLEGNIPFLLILRTHKLQIYLILRIKVTRWSTKKYFL